MKLYSFFNSSTSYRVRIALALKGLQYEYQGVNIRIGEQSTTEYKKLNPSKGVPLFVDDDGFHLNQSLAIIEYLDTKYPNPALLPNDEKLKAQIRAFSYGISCDIHPINNLRILKYLTNQLHISDEQKTAWYKHWVAEGLTAAESTLNTRNKTPYCFGDTPSLADICLIPQIANAERFGCDLSPYPRLMEIYHLCIKHPAFTQAQPNQQPDFIK
ncbi:Stringent starvation protein A [Gallibacterium anatis]|uniref:Stringent starvation protein A n=1 Tax=Gallibacterium anatis TaxID=750 RepID=A0A377H3I4_9PAST|nr:maleylacetoacetate isomerase [Gallibacterium anatis]KGQ52976.1 maleylacetoacetate isomerase [Gallibacterium anatis DSM 16844 = F 149]STO37176.1 Stringent starvation protein A [Gallibacterium anatis]